MAVSRKETLGIKNKNRRNKAIDITSHLREKIRCASDEH